MTSILINDLLAPESSRENNIHLPTFEVSIEHKGEEKKTSNENVEYNYIYCDSMSSSASTTPSPQSPNLDMSEEKKSEFVDRKDTHLLQSIKSLYESIENDYYNVDSINDSSNESTVPYANVKSTSFKKRKSDDEETYNEILAPQPVKSKKHKISNDSSEKYNIDITHLLSLPQKEAAAKLGISESMLCKRFKESTKRKWPFRYLRKIEKTINNLKEMKKIGTISPQDQAKLDDLLYQKKMCLAPVKIRITNYDRLPIIPHQSEDITETHDMSDDSSHSFESYDDEFAVEALGLLRSMSPKPNK